MRQSQSDARGTADAIGRGALAGVAGGLVMTAFQRAVEMPLTGRGESDEPLRAIERLTPLSPPRDPRRRRAANYATHLGIGAAWGAGHALLARRLGAGGLTAGLKVFAILWPGDAVGNAVTGVHDWPWRWSRRDAAVDVVDKLVLAVATAAVYDRLRSGRT